MLELTNCCRFPLHVTTNAVLVHAVTELTFDEWKALSPDEVNNISNDPDFPKFYPVLLKIIEMAELYRDIKFDRPPLKGDNLSDMKIISEHIKKNPKMGIDIAIKAGILNKDGTLTDMYK